MIKIDMTLFVQKSRKSSKQRLTMPYLKTMGKYLTTTPFRISPT